MRLTLHGERGPWVVKVGGLAGGIRMYDEEVAATVAAGFRVAALDTTGDRHDDPLDGPLTWDRLAAEVDAAIDRTGADRAILWGTSFGCLVALAAAARKPGRVSGLLLSHPPEPGGQPAVYPKILRWAERRAHPELTARILFSLGFMTMTVWEGVAPPLWPRIPRLLRASLEAATPPSTVHGKLRLLLTGDPGLPAAPLPVEIIAGAWDLVAPLKGANRLAGRIPGARVVVMGYSGHGDAYARPRTYHRVVTESLKKLT